MITKIIEAVQCKDSPGNWGKFIVMRLSDEWKVTSEVNRQFCEKAGVDPGQRPLLSVIGWSQDLILVFDLQTGEGAFFKPGGLASADLNKHRIWVCPLFEPFLSWLYTQDLADLSTLPNLVELPNAEFDFRGYRRPGVSPAPDKERL